MAESAFGAKIAGELAKPLDPARVQKRQGRGGGSFSYLAGHDVKRRASELFGFGNWGHRVVSLDEIAAVVVEGKKSPGVHVGYRCVVEVWIKVSDASYTTEGAGFGDGVEYGPAARVTACELAIKEAETDALKRAFTDLGDQFGLILYAKEDEKRRIEAERNAPPPPRPNRPADWKALTERWQWVFGGPKQEFAVATVQAWMTQAGAAVAGEGVASADMTQGQRRQVFDALAEALLDLEENRDDHDLSFDVGVRKIVAGALAPYLDGTLLAGPPWALSPEEADTHPQWSAPPQDGAQDDGAGPETPSEEPAGVLAPGDAV